MISADLHKLAVYSKNEDIFNEGLYMFLICVLGLLYVTVTESQMS